MKTRNELYNGEGAELLRFITTYHTLLYEQALRLFPKNRDSIKSLITSLVKQGRIIHDKENDLLCDTAESASNPDYGMIAAFWVLLDFKKAVVYHTSGDFPITELGTHDHTIVSIMDCEAFPGWIKSRQKCIRTISEIS